MKSNSYTNIRKYTLTFGNLLLLYLPTSENHLSDVHVGMYNNRNLISHVPQIKILFPFFFHQSLHPKSFQNERFRYLLLFIFQDISLLAC